MFVWEFCLLVCYFKLSAFISLVLNQDLVNDWKGLFPLVVDTSGITKIVIPKDATWESWISRPTSQTGN